MEGFKICARKGFHMTFANGWTVSVQFGYGNYCANRDFQGSDPTDHSSQFDGSVPPSHDAEIAAWSADKAWHEFEHGDTVDGHKTPDEVLAFMQMVASK